MAQKRNVSEITHPDYKAMISKWHKFRLTFKGGTDFIKAYLQKFSVREDYTDFQNRMKMAYSPSHAKAAVIDIKNSIYQRMSDVVR